MEKNHCYAGNTLLKQLCKLRSQGFQVRSGQNGKVFTSYPDQYLSLCNFLRTQKAKPFIDLNDLPVEQFWFFDLQVKNMGSILVAYLQDISKAFSDYQGGGCAFSFKQSVGGNRGAHADPFDL